MKNLAWGMTPTCLAACPSACLFVARYSKNYLTDWLEILTSVNNVLDKFEDEQNRFKEVMTVALIFCTKI